MITTRFFQDVYFGGSPMVTCTLPAGLKGAGSSQNSSGKWRLRLGSPTKHVKTPGAYCYWERATARPKVYISYIIIIIITHYYYQFLVGIILIVTITYSPYHFLVGFTTFFVGLQQQIKNQPPCQLQTGWCRCCASVSNQKNLANRKRNPTSAGYLLDIFWVIPNPIWLIISHYKVDVYQDGS